MACPRPRYCCHRFRRLHRLHRRCLSAHHSLRRLRCQRRLSRRRLLIHLPRRRLHCRTYHHRRRPLHPQLPSTSIVWFLARLASPVARILARRRVSVVVYYAWRSAHRRRHKGLGARTSTTTSRARASGAEEPYSFVAQDPTSTQDLSTANLHRLPHRARHRSHHQHRLHRLVRQIRRHLLRIHLRPCRRRTW